MGYELTRFNGDVDEELICVICRGVLEEPLQVNHCEHTFCKACIHAWLARQPTCPVDRIQITPSELKQAPRLLMNLLSRLKIACDNATEGCTAVVKLDRLSAHLQECQYSPTPTQCSQGCGIALPLNQLKNHNCICVLREQHASITAELRTVISDQASRIAEMQTEINDHKSDIQFLKECLGSIVESNPQMRQMYQSKMENADFSRWNKSLQTARVTRWGGMISTPDAASLEEIKRALIDGGCPPDLAHKLMDNANERRWPSGISSLATRQLNRRQCESYVAKRISGKQAVVVLSCENNHMPRDLIMEPGLVMIFADGVE